MLNLEKFAGAEMNRAPWRWAWVKDPIPADLMRELCETFPTEGFAPRTGTESYRYRNNGRRLVHLGVEEIIEPESLPARWRELCEFLLSATYRDTIAQLTGLDLSDAGIQVSLYRNDETCWLPPHTDDEPKLVTQTMYFNDPWESAWGGELLILGSKDIDDVVATVPPTTRDSVVHLRGDDAWHAVRPLDDSAVVAHSIERRSLIVAFYDRPETWEGIYRGSPLGSVYDEADLSN
jgi:hypothetical protein